MFASNHLVLYMYCTIFRLKFFDIQGSVNKTLETLIMTIADGIIYDRIQMKRLFFVKERWEIPVILKVRKLR